MLPVIATTPGWVDVRLAQRPNGSTAWLPAGDVTLSRTPYRIVIDAATTELALYDAGRLVPSPRRKRTRSCKTVAFELITLSAATERARTIRCT